jgi:hypothetical protein
MATTILAEVFFREWKQECEARHEALLTAWPNWPAFTALILNHPNPIILEVAKKLNLEAYSGYYDTDAVLYTDVDLVPSAPVGQTWLRRIRVAFEHENEIDSGLFKELSHLMLLDTDLRVLVSYPHTEQRLQQELEFLHKVVAGTDRANQFASDRSILFIAGYRDEDLKTINWTGDIFTNAFWQRLL